MKNKFVSRLLLLVTILSTLHSCRNDYLPDQHEAYNNSSQFQLTSKRVSLSESKHKTKLIPELEKAESEFKKATTNVAGKTVNYGNGISINTDDVIYIEHGSDYYTYTFNINRENAPENAPVENLVLSPLSDGTYRELLVAYNLTPQEKQQLENGHFVDLTGKVTSQELATGTYGTNLMGKTTSTQCHWETYTINVSCPCEGHTVGQDCTCPRGKPKQYVLTWNVCEEVEDTAPSGGLPSTGGSSGGGGTGTPTQPCGGNGVLTQPQDPSSTLGNQNDCNNGTPTLPNLGGSPKDDTPCAQLKKINENTNIKAKFNTLKSNINGTNEKGILIRDIAGNETSDIIEGDGEGNIIYPYKNTSYQPYYYQTYGTAHNHLKNNKKHIGIFTPEDLYQLVGNAMIEMNPANPNVSSTPKKSVIFVLTDKGFFALKITDVLKLADFIVWYDNMTDDETDNYMKDVFQNKKQYNIKPTSTHDQQVIGFLRFMQDKNIGVELYEGNKDTFGDWKKLELMDNGGNFSFNEIPCNL